MEDTLRVLLKILVLNIELVLILVLMEDTLRVRNEGPFVAEFSLNPCFNGRYSQRVVNNGSREYSSLS